MTRWRKGAMTLGPAPVRSWEVSSAEVTSRRWCSASVNVAAELRCHARDPHRSLATLGITPGSSYG
jgi:hypothetical protein